MTEKTGTIDKHQFKITVAVAIMVLIFIIVTTMNTATWKANMESDHNTFKTSQLHTTEAIVDLEYEVESLERRQDGTDITMAEIKTKLISIEALLIDIKEELKTLD